VGVVFVQISAVAYAAHTSASPEGEDGAATATPPDGNVEEGAVKLENPMLEPEIEVDASASDSDDGEQKGE
jgi:hypothetical protein